VASMRIRLLPCEDKGGGQTYVPSRRNNSSRTSGLRTVRNNAESVRIYSNCRVGELAMTNRKCTGLPSLASYSTPHSDNPRPTWIWERLRTLPWAMAIPCPMPVVSISSLWMTARLNRWTSGRVWNTEHWSITSLIASTFEVDEM